MRPVLVPLASAVVFAVHFVTALPCAAQPGFTAAHFDPSIPSAGMGDATVAAFWLDTPNVWINPALVSFQRGIRYRYGTTDLRSGFFEEGTFQSHQIFVGGYGVGLEISGKPIESLGMVRLEHPEITPTGEVIQVSEEVRSLAIGVDIFSLLANIQAARGNEPSPILRRVSVAAGHTWKDFVRDGTFTESSSARDFGALVRVAPFDGIGSLEASPETRYRLELAGGYCEQNYEEDTSSVGFIATTRFGASVRVTMAPPTNGEGLVQDFGTPAIAFGLAWTATDRGFSSDMHHYGAEVSLWDLVFLRGGLDDVGGLRRATVGGGVALTYRKAVGARFDYAWNERTGDQDDWHRFQATAFLDPLGLWKR